MPGTASFGAVFCLKEILLQAPIFISLVQKNLIMEKQSYKNYIRFYKPHHFVFYPIAAVLLGTSVYFSFTRAEKLIWIFISIIFIFFMALSLVLRQHYAR